MVRVFKWLFALGLTALVGVLAIAVLATYDELTATLPPIDRLLEYDPPVATRVYAADGSLIEEFFRERRYRVPIGEIPPMVRNAFLAAEDADFFAHHGVDALGITRAFIANLRAGDVVQGASTITQQVVKALLLSPERSYERKLKEILLSVRLEQHLTKDQILELYLNQIYLGDGNHGVGAAARNYFDKSVQELSAAEAALLAGLPAAPSRYSPNRDPAAARSRQEYVLRRMYEEGFLSTGQYQAALREKLTVLSSRRSKQHSVRNYYTETVRLQLEDMFGAEAPYNQGYTVRTTMQPRLQALAEVAVRNGIERIDAALGYRGPLEHLGEEQGRQRIAAQKAEIGAAPPDPERLYQAVVTRVSPGRLEVVAGPWTATLDVSSVKWAGSVRTRSFRAGDVVQVRSRETAGATAGPRPPASPDEPARFHLAQLPKIEAALIAIDIDDGGIAAMVGGYDFLGSQFNRALQARRQPGSAFKPFIYSAALDKGYTPASILQDAPVEYWDNDKLWQPRNYTRDYKGPIRLRTALEQSRNVVSVKLVDALGVETVIDYLSRFRLDAKFGPNLSIGLGTSEITLRSLTEGYTAFANGGVKVEAVTIRRIEDKDGNAFFTDDPRRRETLSPATAALMTYILEGVVQRGTATSVRALDRPVAGKTGTTNEQRDAWFIGYTPDLAVGVWVGFDDPNMTMGRMGTGGRVAAPIWLDFMKPALVGTPVRDFEIPDDIRCVNIDPATGTRANEWTSKPFLECFKEGTEPGKPATEAKVPQPRVVGDPGDPVHSPRGPGGMQRNAPADPRWSSPRDSSQPLADRWSGPAPILPESAPPPYPYEPRPVPERLRAHAVPTESGTEIRLYRDSEVPYASPPAGPPAVAPGYPSPDYQPPGYPPPGYQPPAAAAPQETGRLWGTAPIEPLPPANAGNGVRVFPSTAPEPRD